MNQWFPVLTATIIANAIGCVVALLSIEARWGAIGPSLAMLGVYAVTGIVCLVLIIRSASSKRRVASVWSLMIFCTTLGFAALVSRHLPQSVRDAEIADAIANGLIDDCESIVANYRDNLQFKQDGYVRLFPGSKEYDSLPRSVREFHPVYVTIEQCPFGSDQPLNIGLCKNGFGGFHTGVRVFQIDPNIPTSPNRQRVAPNVYYYMNET